MNMDTKGKNAIQFTVAQKVNYLGTALTKLVQDDCAENYKTDERN